jgi:NRAMP (natural resistance-associated macrophage protein)-like metal ion transporter
MNLRHESGGLAPETPEVRVPSEAEGRSSRSLTSAVRGRRTPGLRRPPILPRRLRPRRLPRLWRFFAILGPGLIAAYAGNDAGGIATYSEAGAQTGYELLWALLLIVVAVIVVQEMAARLGVSTGKGLMALIREEFGVRWAVVAAAVVIIANGGTTICEFAGVAAALELFGLPPELSAPLTGGLLGYLVLRSNYARVERVFLAMGAVFVAYVITVFVVHPNWGRAVHDTFVPTFSGSGSFVFLLIAFIGTSVTPYMQLYLQSAVADKGTAESDYGYVRAEVIASSILADVVVACILITAAATLHAHGVFNITTPGQAAHALSPLVGASAKYLFAVGLLGASLLAAGVLPISTAFVVAEAFGTERGLSRSVGEAPIFYAVFVGLLTAGGICVLIPGVNLIAVLLVTQVVDGVLLPVVLVFMLRLSNNVRLMGKRANGRLANIVGGTTAAVLIFLTLVLLFDTIKGG